MRVFVAIDFDNKLKAYLKEKQNELKTYCTKGNFTHEENFHLTIVFIGEVKPEQIPEIEKVMDNAAGQSEGFTLKLSHFDYFKRQDEYLPWIGLDGDLTSLNDLYRKLHSKLKVLGFSLEERDLKAHITLGRRVKFSEPVQIIKKNFIIDPITVPVTSIVLMESSRVNNKLTYIPLYEKNLNIRS
ncbi:MAG: RNA 2',3'-cyclic phosphodiesterase [Epulopiscium sp.]|nr:RNA 2',3'-cyclic phosphodiesterase [Candidatus Epulonipiscium sp.]